MKDYVHITGIRPDGSKVVFPVATVREAFAKVHELRAAGMETQLRPVVDGRWLATGGRAPDA